MATTQLNERLGAASSVFQSDIDYQPKVSAFDFSKKVSGTFSEGMIIPLDFWRTLPKDQFDIDVRYKLDVNPMSVPPMTNYKFVIHAYYTKEQWLWKGAETFITKGRNASISLTRPSIRYDGDYSDDRSLVPEYNNTVKYSISTPHSLTTYLGLPPIRYNKFPSTDTTNGASTEFYLPFANMIDKTGADASTKQAPRTHYNALEDSVNAEIPFFYQKIVRSNYMPTNLLQDNKIWWPDDICDDDWRIASDGSNLSVDGHFVPIGTSLPSSPIANFIPVGDSNSSKFDNCVNILQMRYAQYGDDYFVSAKPWLVRGTEQEIEADITQISHELVGTGNVSLYTDKANDSGSIFTQSNKKVLVNMSGQGYPLYTKVSDIASALQVNTSGSGILHLTANTLRSLIAYSIKDEIDAITNGNYNSTIKAHYGGSAGHEDYEPQYIGGCVDYLSMNDILQTSASTDDSKLGSPAGIGGLSAGGRIGHFTSPDHGYIMIVGFVVPEVTYTNGIGHDWTDLTQDTVFWPEYCNLGFEPILNKEIYVKGQTSIDNDLFGYQTRFSYYKARRNTTCGMLSLAPDEDMYYSAFSQSRIFYDTPALSNEFTTLSPNNLRRDYLAYPANPSYRLQFATDVKAVRPLPYRSIPARFGM